MPKFLKGNYRVSKEKRQSVSVKRKASTSSDLTRQFEKTALAKLGGSLCFVMKKNTFVWSGEGDEATREGSH